MKDVDFENLITNTSVIDSGTANILGEYYIKGIYVDYGLGFLFVFIFFVGYLLICKIAK